MCGGWFTAGAKLATFFPPRGEAAVNTAPVQPRSVPAVRATLKQPLKYPHERVALRGSDKSLLNPHFEVCARRKLLKRK